MEGMKKNGRTEKENIDTDGGTTLHFSYDYFYFL
jgi:hypothetical protein